MYLKKQSENDKEYPWHIFFIKNIFRQSTGAVYFVDLVDFVVFISFSSIKSLKSPDLPHL